MPRVLKSFPTRPRTLIRADGEIERGGDRLKRFVLGEQVVISRALCHFEVASSPPGAPGPRSVQAIKLAARARTPFKDPGFHFEWRGGRVGIWSWPSKILGGLDDFEGKIIPESVLREPGEGPRLVACLDGVEGQVFEAGILVASRWWPGPPSGHQWRDFLRAARSDIDAPLPPPETSKLLEQPAPAPMVMRFSALQKYRGKDIAALAAILLGAPTLFLGGQLAHLGLQKAALEAELTELRAATAELGAARERAQSAVSTLAIYSQAIDRAHPTLLLAEFAETLSDYEAQLQDFALRGETLSATVSSSGEFRPAPLVEALETLPLFSEVRIEPSRPANHWAITGRSG